MIIIMIIFTEFESQLHIFDTFSPAKLAPKFI